MWDNIVIGTNETRVYMNQMKKYRCFMLGQHNHHKLLQSRLVYTPTTHKGKGYAERVKQYSY